jgi:hypothetical protein
MAAPISSEEMQAKIAAARRDAEGLKDRIKRKKDDLADATREFYDESQSALFRKRRAVQLRFSSQTTCIS